MSLTINGTTNIITAASGLTIAGNTAITGTLSVTATTSITAAQSTLQQTSSTGTNPVVHSLTNTGGMYYLGVNDSGAVQFGGNAYSLVRYAPAGRTIQDIIGGTGAITTVSSTGLTVGGLGGGAASGITSVVTATAAAAVVNGTQFTAIGYNGGYGAGITMASPASGGAPVAMAKIVADGIAAWNSTATTQDAQLSFHTALDGALSVVGYWNTTSLSPGADNTINLGSASLGWKELFCDNGTINTSDARRKTEVYILSAAEINAAKQLAKEIGSFKFLAAVAEKGDAARLHIGMTVQRAIEIMEANNLDPFAYSFICHDSWGDVFVEHPAIEAVAAQPAVLDDDGNVITPAVEAVEGQEAWTEQTRVAGDKYSFRVHELLLFMAVGFEARLSALEAA